MRQNDHILTFKCQATAAAQSDFTRSDADTEHSNVMRDVTNDNAVDLMSVLRSVMHAAKSLN